MSEPTKGPYEVRYSASGYPYQIVAPKQDDHAPGKVGTAITRWGAISLPSSDEGRANARLLAASWDMREALERLIKADDAYFDRDSAQSDEEVMRICEECVAATKQAEAALAKSRGEAQ